jgi:D-amino-acid oxidase
MGQRPSRVVVVGAGVVGLSCAVRLAESGRRVDVLARELPQESTSVVAAALWYPYKALPQQRVTAWAARSYEAFAGLASEAASGVRLLPGTEVFARPAPDPWWVGAVPELRRVVAPAGYADAWSFDAPVVDMPVYLDWLRRRLADLGGTLTRASLGALPQVADDHVLVDCAGLGARRLAGETDVHPVRGQVVHLTGVPLERWWLDAAGPTYVVPRGEVVVVGGTDEDGEWSRTPSPAAAAAMLARATALVPELAGGEVRAHRVGLRPVRSQVRVETDAERPRVVHCYGHGGAGVTLSWGTADEVCALVRELDEG